MLHKFFSTSLLAALFAMLVGVSSLNAQDIGKKEMMKKHAKMKKEMAAVNVAKADANMDGKVYVCSMGCAVTDKKGLCPKCDMSMIKMSLDDTEKMLKGEGFKVVENKLMRKGCSPDCTKPCCTEKCKANCTKECCAKKCEAGYIKTCCAKTEMKDAKSCVLGCSKSCCTKSGKPVSKTKAFNNVCPMSGHPVDASVKTVSYKGKNFGFCGSGCAVAFIADPDKYSKNISECGKKYETTSI